LMPSFTMMFPRVGVVAAPTRALMRRQRHTIASAVAGVLPSVQFSAATKRREAVTVSKNLNYHSCNGSNHLVRYTQPFDAAKIGSNISTIISTNRATAGKYNGNVHIIRTFQTVGEYHDVADETLHSIQDAVEDYLEEHYDAGVAEKEDDIPEVNYASGVLTIYLPPHGTWVINKQTPNEQLWWSSPISGPKRYEYDANQEKWVHSRAVDDGDIKATYGEGDTLGGMLNKEFEELFGEGLGV